MRRLMVLGLLTMLFLGVGMSLCAKTQEGSFGTQSSLVFSNIIDHLPFTINTTDVYYITKDLEVNGTGITILADNAVLLGQGHTITGNGTWGEGLEENVGILVKASDATICECKIGNFNLAMVPRSGARVRILHNILSNCKWGIYMVSSNELVRGNIIANNTYGTVIASVTDATIFDNCFVDNGINAVSDVSDIWNTTKSSESNIISQPFLGGNYWHDYSGIDTDGDGIGNTNIPYTSNGYIHYTGDYLPLVDTSSPHYDLRTFNSSSPSVSLGITWMDNVQLDKVTLQLDGINYTNSAKISESFGFNEYYQVEHRATYSSFFILPVGPHTYRWYANDTRNQWNSTQLQSFNVIETSIESIDISSTLKVLANITCQGAGNITEVIDTVDLEFNIDGTWYSKDTTYNQSTKLYSALVPEYNQLANKTILIYVVAKTKQNQFLNSDVYIYNVPQWVAADINRDGKVTILDIVKATSQYGKP